MPGVPLGDDLAVDELQAADVQAAGRLVQDEQPEVPVELARHDEFLLVAAGQRARQGRRGRSPDVELLDRLLGRLSMAASLRTQPVRRAARSSR